MLSDLRYRIRALLRRDAVAEDLDAELRFHIEHQTAKQVSASVLLLICTGLLLRGAVHLSEMDTGLNARGVVDIEIRDKSRAQVVDALAASPLVQSMAATSNPIPFDGTPPVISVTAAGSAELVRAVSRYVSPDYFAVFDIPIREGRSFSREEARSDASVAVVSESAARRLWPGRRAVGQLLHLHGAEGNLRLTRTPPPAVVQIVGTVRDIATGYSNSEASRTAVFFPTTERHPGTALMVRVRGEVDAALHTLDNSLETIDAGAVERIHKIEEFKVFQGYPFRVAYWISATLGSLALLLTLSGVYGVLSYLVAIRSKEIAIRMALGDTARGAAGLVLVQSMRLSAIGVMVGAILGLGASRMLAALLVMMNTYDPVVYAGAILLVVATCACTSYFPALRAARIDPFATLRRD